jgi:hypothetical protein
MLDIDGNDLSQPRNLLAQSAHRACQQEAQVLMVERLLLETQPAFARQRPFDIEAKGLMVIQDGLEA